MNEEKPNYEELQARLEQAEATLAALRRGEIDSLLGEGGPLLVQNKTVTDELTRLRAEAERLAQQWQATFDATADAVWILDAEQRVLRSNRAAEEAFDCPLPDMIGRRCCEIVHGTAAPIPGCPFLPMRQSRQRESLEMQVGERWYLVTVDPLLDADNCLTGAVHIARDITARKQAEEKLRQSEEQYRLLVETTHDIIMLYDRQGRISYVNQAGRELAGFELAETLGQPITAFVPPERLAEIEELYRRRTAGDLSVFRYETEFINRAGQRIPVEVNSTPVVRGRQLEYVLVVARDISERKEAERKIRESEETYRNLFQNAQVGLFRTRISDGKILESNEQLARMFGYDSREEFIAEYVTSQNYVDAGTRERMLSELRKNGTIQNFQARFYRKDGSIFWVQYSAKIYPEKGWIEGVAEDITERKQAEAMLQERAWQLALLNDIGGQVAALLDLDQVLDRAAHLAQQRFGFHHVGLFLRAAGEDRLVLRARAGEYASLFPPDHSLPLGQGLVGWVGRHGQTLLANDVTAEPRYVNLYPDRLPTRSELSVPIRIGDEIVGVLDLQSPQLNAFDPGDVTTLETLAGQLAVAINNARLYSQAAQRNRELDLLNRVIAATAAAGEAFEPVLKAVCRELALALKVPHIAAALFDRDKTQATIVAEYQVTGPDQSLAPAWPPALGRPIPLTDYAAAQSLLTYKAPLVIEQAQTDPRLVPVHDLLRRRGTVSLLLLPLIVDGEVVGNLGLGTTEPRPFPAAEINLAWRVAEQVSGVLARLRLQQERRQLEAQVQQAQKMEAVGRLAGGVAHDFNNLLTVVHLSTRLLERQLRPQDPLYQHVQRIQEAARRATDLTKQLLAFSRREIIVPQLLNLNDVLTELDKMLRRLIGEDIELTTRLAANLWPVRADPTHIEQAVVNLAVNARDAMPHGGKLTLETANVALDAAYAAHHLEVEPGDYVMLAVSDTGVGMSAEVKAHLFEPFFTTKERGKGTGLGLSTVFGIVKQNQGHIWVYSEEGQGTTFKIYLPKARAEGEAKAQAEEKSPAPPLPPPPAATILLVEDDDAVRALARDILAAQGYHVLTAQDGVEALQVARGHQGPLHLLLTDVVLPRLSGRALADQLRSERPGLPVLFTSGYTDDAIMQHGVLDEGVHFLSKPFEPEALIQKIGELLAALSRPAAEEGKGAP